MATAPTDVVLSVDSFADETAAKGEPKVDKNSPEWHEHLTEFELQRLRFFMLSGQINETLIEVVDFWTDIVFVATLWVFSQDGNPSDSFLGILASTNGFAVTTGEDRDFGLFHALFVAATGIMAINVVGRFFVAMRFIKYRKHFDGPTDWAWFFFGVLVCQVEPHNGVLLIQNIVKDEIPKISDYESVKTEIRMNSLLLFTEDIPQFIIQVIFALNVAQKALTVPWYVTTLVTVLKIVSVLGGLSIMGTRLKGLKIIHDRHRMVIVDKEN